MSEQQHQARTAAENGAGPATDRGRRQSQWAPRLLRKLVVGAAGLGLGIGAFASLSPSRAAVSAGAAPRAQDTPPSPGAPAASAGAGVKRVLIISEDGMRPDLIYQQHMPWHEKLYTGGSYSWHARTIRTASTLPSHASMLSGVDVNLHRLTWNNWRPTKGFIQSPTIFKVAGDKGLKTAAFVGKFKLRHILPAGTVGVFERPGYYCKKVSEEAARYLTREKPDMTFVHFSDPDEAGHSAGWMSERQKSAARAADQCLGTIVQALEGAGMLDSTMIIVSADHGGHNHNHSGALTCDREIPWIAHGPQVRRGYTIRGKISTMDTAPTALTALGLPLPDQISGRPIKEIFQ